MKVLAIDTATLQATVAVCAEDHALAEHHREVTTHSEGLLQLVDQALSDAQLTLTDIGAIVCGQGPGSFTGLRIGLSTAKGLCFATGKPLYCVSSLAALAYGVLTEGEENRLIGALIDARRGQLYCGWFEGGRLLGSEAVRTPEQVAEAAGDRSPILVGNGALHYQERLLESMPGARMGPPDSHPVNAVHLARAAQESISEGRVADLQTGVPVYLRPPDIR